MQSRSHCPRPEYPRPDRQRAFIEGTEWLNLNGPWEFRFDADRRGEAERWFEAADPWSEQIIVPFCWESLAAWGEGDSAGNENYYATRVFREPLTVSRENHRSAARYEVGWYRRSVRIPHHEHWEGKRVILTIGAADFFTDCWCNGQHIGRHEGGYTPFEFDLTDALEEPAGAGRTARLAIRVEDPMDNREQPVGKQWQWYTTTSGIWQTVFLEARAPTHVDHFQIRPHTVAQTVSLHFVCRNADDGDEIVADIAAPGGGPAFQIVAPVAGGTAQATAAVPEMRLWDNNNPQLYRAKFTLRHAGADCDVVHSYFGMRTVGTAEIGEANAPSALTLNGEPIYLRGALHQSYYPEGVYTAGDTQVLRNDIEFAKRAGFDFLRLHIKIDDPLLLYYADTMGILLMCDFPNFGEGGDTPLGRKRFTDMMRAAIRRDFNHPSIIAWCLFNETWGFGGQLELVKKIASPALPEHISAETAARLANEASHSWVQEMWELAKRLDPTRLIEDMSVVDWAHLRYYAHGETDINSWHFYIDDYVKAKAHIETVVGETYAGSTFNYSEGFSQAGQPLINSEYGGVGALDGDRDVSWSFKFLTNELRRHPSLSAYIYTELHDVEWEYNGLLNFDRTPKEFGYDPTIINQGDVLPINAAPITRCAPGEKIAVEVQSSHYSRRKRTGVVLQWRLTGIDALGRTHLDLAGGSVPIAFTQYRVEAAHVIELALPAVTMLCTLWVYALAPDGERIASNFVQQFVSSDGAGAARERVAGGWILRGAIAEWAAAEWSAGSSSQAEAESNGSCFGRGTGFFEWSWPTGDLDLGNVQQLKVLCEASARCEDTAQTDGHRTPTLLELSLNDVPVFSQLLPDHPHDSRGALSYLRGARGAYGYLAQAVAEGDLLRQILEKASPGTLRLRCAVRPGEKPGGLTIYGADCGRHPLPPTVVLT